MYDDIKDWMTAKSVVLLARDRFEPQPHFPVLAAHRWSRCGGPHCRNASPTPHRRLRNLCIAFLLVASPVVSALLALRWFSDGHLQPQPVVRLARLGRWTTVDRFEAEAHPLYGTSGIMVSLLVGMMLNVPVRVAEYLTSMPPIPAASPHWLSVLHFAMTFDAAAFTSLYMIAFVAALRRVPLFPRLLLAIWLSDLAMQLLTARMACVSAAAAGCRRGTSNHAGRQRQEGADRHGAVVTLSPALDASERDLPTSRPSLALTKEGAGARGADRIAFPIRFPSQNRNEIRLLRCGFLCRRGDRTYENGTNRKLMMCRLGDTIFCVFSIGYTITIL